MDLYFPATVNSIIVPTVTLSGPREEATFVSDTWKLKICLELLRYWFSFGSGHTLHLKSSRKCAGHWKAVAVILEVCSLIIVRSNRCSYFTCWCNEYFLLSASGNSPIANKLRLYARVCRKILGMFSVQYVCIFTSVWFFYSIYVLHFSHLTMLWSLFLLSTF